tara:strand:- start:1194 stop:1652 length:459 start_codon:yes stop_codon:yes gene_type:complete
MYEFSQPNDQPGTCGKCGGTGNWHGGPFVNGRATRTGRCHSCRGKGHQTQRDIDRNHYYNERKAANVLAADIAHNDIDDDYNAVEHLITGHRLERTADDSCACGSGKVARWIYDARRIPVAKACPDCTADKLEGYREDIFTDANYWTDEPVD